MKTFFYTICTVMAVTMILTAGEKPWSANVTWQGNRATITFQEPLSDPTAAAKERPFSIIVHPYISWLSADSAKISWETIAEKKVLDESPYFISDETNYPFATKLALRTVELTDLKPDTPYRYRLTAAGDGWSYEGPTYTFRTFPPVGSKKFRFAVIGDSQRGWEHPHWRGYGGTMEQTVKVAQLIKEWDPPMVLHVGDLTLEGSFNTWRAKFNYIAMINNLTYMRSSFTLACLGNHDGLKLHSYYFPYMIKDTPPESTSNYAFYSVNIANLHFICTTASPSRTALRKWMDADLAKNKQPWVIAFDHYPYHSLGFFNSNPDAMGCCQLLTKYMVQLYICGHDHSYQRTARISNDNQRTLADDATVHLISGGAGGQFGQYWLPTPSWNLAHVNRFHYTQVEVDDQVITFRAVDLEGNIFDQWKMPIKGQPETIFDGKSFVMVDDRDPEVVYNNPWTCESMSNALLSNPTWKQRRNQTNCWRSHASFSSNSGDFASLKFTGTSIAWIGTKGNEQGLADVFIDGELVAPDLDTSATKLQYQQILFEKTDLPPGEHEIKIVVKGKFGAATKRGGAVDIDAFRYTP